MKNKIGWLIIIIEIGLIGWIINKYQLEIKNFIDLFLEPAITETETRTEIVQVSEETEKQIITTPTNFPTPTIKATPTGIIKKKIYPTPTGDNEPWGIARQIDDVTWTMKVGQDAKMATAKEIWEALNEYRKVQGSQILNWDTKLADYAQSRAKYLN